MARTDPQVNIRIPQALKDRLDEASRKSGTSLTEEICMRLEATFGQDLDPDLMRAFNLIRAVADRNNKMSRTKTTR